MEYRCNKKRKITNSIYVTTLNDKGTVHNLSVRVWMGRWIQVGGYAAAAVDVCVCLWLR